MEEAVELILVQQPLLFPIYFKKNHILCQKNMKFEEINSNKICIFYYPLDKLQIGGVHMDNKSNKSLSNFFKKEGFYLILFICLCIVATVAVITTIKQIN